MRQKATAPAGERKQPAPVCFVRACCFWWGIGLVGPIALQQGTIPHFTVGHLQRMQTAAALDLCLLDGDFAVQQQGLHAACPALQLLSVKERQLAQIMHVAQCVLTGIVPIRPPTIMHTHFLKALKNAEYFVTELLGLMLCEGLGLHHSTTLDKRLVGHSMVEGLYVLLGRRCPLAPQMYRQQAVCEVEGVPFASRMKWPKCDDEVYVHVATRWEIEVLFGDGKEEPGLDQYQLMSAIAIEHFWTLAMLAHVFLEEERQLLQTQWQRPVTIGEARREIQRRHRRQLLDWLHDRFQSGIEPDSLYELFSA